MDIDGRGVEGLSHRDENRAGRLEPLDELCKVGEGTGQPVDLVDHNLVDETCVDVGEQALQARALQGSSREPRVLVDGWQQHPALRFLARATYAAQASRCASRELNSCSRPSSALFRV